MPFSLIEGRKRRWLTVCQRGNCRSVHLAAILKDDLNQDAIACGVTAAADETMKMLGEWADVIVLCDNDLDQFVPDHWRSKMISFHVGEDRFFRGWNRELCQLFYDYLDKYKYK